MEDMLQKIKEKVKLGFDKVHIQLVTRDNTKHAKTAKQKYKSLPPTCIVRSKSEPIEFTNELKQGHNGKVELSRSFNLSQKMTEDEEQCSCKLCLAYLQNKDRLQPELPPFQELPIENISNNTDTDHDQLHIYDQVQDFFKKSAVAERVEKSLVKTNSLPYSLHANTFVRQGQSRDDFYSYSVEELVECLNRHGLGSFAIDCNTHKLDGAFFRNFDLNVLKTDPVSLNNTDLLKLRKLIEDGWRPKLDRAMHTAQV